MLLGAASPEHKAAIALRRLLRAQRREWEELRAAKQQRCRQLDAAQQQRLGGEREKLRRLAAVLSTKAAVSGRGEGVPA